MKPVLRVSDVTWAAGPAVAGQLRAANPIGTGTADATAAGSAGGADWPLGPAGASRGRVASSVALRRRSDRLLVTLDSVLAVTGAVIAGNLLHRTITVAWTGYLLVALATVLAGRWLGLYRRAALRPGSRLAEPAAGAAAAGGAAAALVVLLSPPGPGFAWAALVALALFVSLLASRAVLARLRRALVPLGVGLERYAVLGESAPMRRLVADLTRAPGAPFRVVGMVPEGLTAKECAARVGALSVDGLLVSPDLDPAQIGALSRALAGHDVEVLVAPRAHDLDAQVTSVTHLQGIPLLRLGGAAPRRRAVRTPARDRRSSGVAILGTRGIPATYGGFETFAEQLSLRLVDRDIPVTVYCRSHFASGEPSWRGVKLVTLGTIRSKYLDTVVHTALSAAHLVATGGPRDVLLCNAANAPIAALLRLAGRRVVLNVDGLEWRRGKWGARFRQTRECDCRYRQWRAGGAAARVSLPRTLPRCRKHQWRVRFPRVTWRRHAARYPLPATRIGTARHGRIASSPARFSAAHLVRVSAGLPLVSRE